MNITSEYYPPFGCLNGRKSAVYKIYDVSQSFKRKKPFSFIQHVWQLVLDRNFFIRRKVNDGRVRVRVRLESQTVQRQIILREEDHPITVQVTQASFVFISIFSLLWESSNKFHKILSLLHRSCITILFLVWLYFFFL